MRAPMNPYVLGILWGLGRYVDEMESPDYQYFFLRHNREHFLRVVRHELGLSARLQETLHKGRPQYRLKVTGLDIDALYDHGWEPRWSEARGYPNITEHRDFIRAYLEIHSRADIITLRKHGRPPHRHPRLRIYGNQRFLEQLSDVLVSQIGVGPKTVQQATSESEVSGILYYQSRNELQSLLAYLYPLGVKYFDREWYAEFCEVIRGQ